MKEKIEDEIDLIEILKKIWLSRFRIIKISVVITLFGILNFFISPIEYTASSTFIHQYSNKDNIGGLGGLASIAGFSLGSSANNREISPKLYPKILNSVPVMRSILEINIPKDSSFISYKSYLLNKSKSFSNSFKKHITGITSFLVKKNESMIIKNEMYVSNSEKSLFNILNDQINLNVNDKDGFIELSVKSEDALVSALLTKQIIELLQKKIIEFKVKQGSEYLEYTKKQFLNKQKEFYKLQDNLAISKDKNMVISSERYQNILKQQEDELFIVKSVYQELAKQLEQAKLQVALDTPIFSTLKPVTIPNEKSSPGLIRTTLMWLFIGLIFSIFYTIINSPLKNIWKRINSK